MALLLVSPLSLPLNHVLYQSLDKSVEMCRWRCWRAIIICLRFGDGHFYGVFNWRVERRVKVGWKGVTEKELQQVS